MYATTAPPPQRLLVFARLPERGRVKTRLAADLGDERALAVYEAMLRDVLRSIGTSAEGTEVEVMWAPSENANGETLRRAFGDHTLAMQTGETLGDRLAMAFSERFFFHRTMKIVAIGVDDPRLSRELVDHAFALLDSCEWVVGPATDGGYYLIGCRAAAYDTEIFTDIAWGTGEVLSRTLERIGGWGSTVATLPPRSDLDVIDDLRRFASEGGNGEVGALLREWGIA
ncbi:MAG TPA: TIGR04282 family arsenosugar biosynthesis glycosyltransferase [Thermoanaerobaculia bacterium]|jgi:rSAM/selenodomain-associated transferase 1|nr:TIGR04282 family arsenosugar biosynthesis glycosyltransferase [Thermoanaerobaculia bacterium]